MRFCSLAEYLVVRRQSVLRECSGIATASGRYPEIFAYLVSLLSKVDRRIVSPRAGHLAEIQADYQNWRFQSWSELDWKLSPNEALSLIEQISSEVLEYTRRIDVFHFTPGIAGAGRGVHSFWLPKCDFETACLIGSHNRERETGIAWEIGAESRLQMPQAAERLDIRRRKRSISIMENGGYTPFGKSRCAATHRRHVSGPPE